MPPSQLKCSRCQGKMDIGFLMDKSHTFAQLAWVEGIPEKSFWTGLKISDRTNIPVLTFRCEKCGYLESFANVQVES